MLQYFKEPLDQKLTFCHYILTVYAHVIIVLLYCYYLLYLCHSKPVNFIYLFFTVKQYKRQMKTRDADFFFLINDHLKLQKGCLFNCLFVF